jgi:hypothetical protein
MEATSLHPDLHTTRGRHLSNRGARQDMQKLAHDATYTLPRAQPVDIIIPPAIPSPREDHVLEVVQQPEIAKVAAPREKGKSLSLSFAPSSSTKYRIPSSANTTRSSPRRRTLVQEPGVKEVRWSQLLQQSPYSLRQNLFEQPIFLRQCRTHS